MIGSPTRKSLDNRLRRVQAAVVEFRRALDTKCAHEFLLIALKDKQAQLWSRLEPRLTRIQIDAAQGCTPSLHWIAERVEELGYVLARGELLSGAVRAAQVKSAETMAALEERRRQAQRERAEYQAAALSRGPAPTRSRSAPPKVILQRAEVTPAPAEFKGPETASTPPSCDYGVGSEAWLRELERVRQQSAPAFAGASRSEDVIPRK